VTEKEEEEQEEEGDAPLLSLHEEILEIEQGLFLGVHVHKGSGDTGLAGTTGSTDLMDVVFDLFWHGVVLQWGGEEAKGEMRRRGARAVDQTVGSYR
jgi:hypothetical protein